LNSPINAAERHGLPTHMSETTCFASNYSALTTLGELMLIAASLWLMVVV